ncbi:hypothetical protein AURDEDRAFT_136854 [Auricularia subglabra TFB-10046 SS5]|nr:hypothetical protein AURDEDRAFT_136854 [Auricularia subglabra TFB-10046 SS5]
MSVNDSSTWHPNEPALALWNERSYLDGIFIGAVAYGVHATLFFITLKLLWARPRTTWKDYIWISYIVVLFTISSIGNGTQLKFTQMIYIDNREYPGGPAAYFVDGSTDFMAVFCNSVYILNTWLQDGLLMYRFWIIFGRGYLILAFPALVFLATIALAIVLIVMLSRPGMTIWSAVNVQLITAYWSISVAFNILLTIAIVSRLLLMRYKIGRTNKALAIGPYVSVSAMLIESAFLYSICGLIFLVSFGVGSPVQNLVLPTLAQVESIAPLLIIMRVAQGNAWSADTAQRVTGSTLGFDKAPRPKPPGSGQTTQLGSYNLSSYPASGVETQVETITWKEPSDGDRYAREKTLGV